MFEFSSTLSTPLIHDQYTVRAVRRLGNAKMVSVHGNGRMYFRAGLKKTVGDEKLVSTVGKRVSSVLSDPKRSKLLTVVVTNSKVHK